MHCHYTLFNRGWPELPHLDNPTNKQTKTQETPVTATMPPKARHVCHLPFKDTSGLPKLPPNATWFMKTSRKIRKLFLLNPSHFRCKKLFRNMSSILTERKKHCNSKYSFVIHPLSTFNSVLEAVFCVTWFYTLVCETLLVYSDVFPWEFRIIQTHILFPIRMLVIAMFFNVGYIDHKTKFIIMESKKIICRYLTTYFIFDLLSTSITKTVPAWLVQSCSLEHYTESYCYEAFSIARILSTWVRINTILKFLNDTLLNMGFSKYAGFIVVYTMKTFLYIYCLTFIQYLVPFLLYRGKWPPQSWLHLADVDHALDDPFVNFFEGFMITICYFFGMDYKFEITLTSEQISVAVTSFVGRLYTLYLLADILNVFGIAEVSESQYDRQRTALREFMIAKNLPENLRHRMMRFYEFKFQKRYFRENETMSALSEQLRIELFFFAAKKLIEKVILFKNLPNATLSGIISSMRAETYSPKDVIVKAGEIFSNIFFISSGTVAIFNAQGLELTHLEDGDDFGTSGFFLKKQLYNLVAVETTEIFCISKDDFMLYLEPFPEVRNLFFKAVKEKLLKLADLENRAVKGPASLADNIRAGNILESREVRLVAE